MRYRSGSVFKQPKSKLWWISYYLDGKRIRESSKTDDKKEAEKLLAKRLAEQKAPDKRSIGELLNNLLRNFEINHKSPWGKIVVNAHLKPFFGTVKSDKLSPAILTEYIDTRKKAGRANGTINRELTLLRRAFNIAQVPYPKFPKLTENNVRKGFVTPEQFEKLMSELPDYVCPIALFAYETGCRKGEILNLKWPQVDIDNSIVRLEPGETKSKEPRMIPLSESLREVLNNLPRVCEHVFTHDGRQIKDFRGAWDEACIRAGLPELLFHDFRRTGVRNLVRAGVPERVAMDISGHRTRSVFDRYNIVSETDLRDAMKLLEKKRTQADRNAAAKANRGSLAKFFEKEDT